MYSEWNKSSKLYSTEIDRLAPDDQPLIDRDHLDVEDKDRVGRNAREVLLAVGEVGRDRDATLAANLHTSDTDVPTLDHLTGTELEGERLALLVGYLMSVLPWLHP